MKYKNSGSISKLLICVLKKDMIDRNDIKLPSNKRFGYFFSAVFFLISVYFFSENNVQATTVFLFFAIFLTFLTLFNPSLLAIPNRLWMQLGLMLGLVVSPLVLGAIYFIIFSPIGLFLRIIQRDELSLKQKADKTFWKVKSLKTNKLTDFEKQF